MGERKILVRQLLTELQLRSRLNDGPPVSGQPHYWVTRPKHSKRATFKVQVCTFQFNWPTGSRKNGTSVANCAFSIRYLRPVNDPSTRGTRAHQHLHLREKGFGKDHLMSVPAPAHIIASLIRSCFIFEVGSEILVRHLWWRTCHREPRRSKYIYILELDEEGHGVQARKEAVSTDIRSGRRILK